MKYICTESEYGEEIFTFPRKVDHDAMAEVLTGIKAYTQDGAWKRVLRIPVSAGFIDLNNNCFGESETLDLKSRGIVDTALVREQRI